MPHEPTLDDYADEQNTLASFEGDDDGDSDDGADVPDELEPADDDD